MSRTKRIESAYWHISNSGMTISILERRDFRSTRSGIAPMVNRSWIFEVTFQAFGSGPTFQFPITHLMVTWLRDALERVQAVMEAPQLEPTDGEEFAFRDKPGYVAVRGGQKVDKQWTRDGLDELEPSVSGVD